MIPLRDINPTRSPPILTIALIAVNVGVFVFQVMLPAAQLEQFVLAYATTPFEITRGVDLDPKIPFPVYLTLFSGMFMHGSWIHIIGNMLYLWIFGNNIEDRFGHVRFLAIYLAWGVLAALAQVFIDPNSRIPALGASGAVAGVLGAYIVIFPSARVDVLVLISAFLTSARLPAVLVIGQWILLQFLSGFTSLGVGEDSGGIAYFAHIGGAVAGLIGGAIYRAAGARGTGRF